MKLTVAKRIPLHPPFHLRSGMTRGCRVLTGRKGSRGISSAPDPFLPKYRLCKLAS